MRRTLIQFSNPFTSQTNCLHQKKRINYSTFPTVDFPRYNFISRRCVFVLPRFPLLNWLASVMNGVRCFSAVFLHFFFQYWILGFDGIYWIWKLVDLSKLVVSVVRFSSFLLSSFQFKLTYYKCKSAIWLKKCINTVRMLQASYFLIMNNT